MLILKYSQMPVSIAPFPMTLPANIASLSADNICRITENFKHLTVSTDGQRSLENCYDDLCWVLPFPYTGYPSNLDAAGEGFLIRRELTVLLYAAYETATYAHVNDFGLDGSHFFLIDVLLDMVQCARGTSVRRCAEHQRPWH
jgi:hypothetical protein